MKKKPYTEDQKAYHRQWYHKNKHRILEKKNNNSKIWRDKRRQWLWEIKSTPCSDCKNTFPPYVMQFDHINDDKAFDVGEGLLNKSKEELLLEISKCEIVCANCHAIRTHERR